MGFVVLFHLVQRLCSDVAAELCGVPRQCRWEGPELPPAPVGTYPLTPADRGPVHLLYIVDVPLGLILLTSVAVLWAISFCCHFFFSQRTISFVHPAHSKEFLGGVWSWGNLFGSVCSPKQTGFPLRVGALVKKGFSQGALS